MKKIGLLIGFIVFNLMQAFAQDGYKVDMAEGLRSSGKIYVVVITLAIIFVSLAIYLFSIDRRLRKIEKDN